MSSFDSTSGRLCSPVLAAANVASSGDEEHSGLESSNLSRKTACLWHFFAFPCRQDVGPKWKNRLTQKQWKYQLIPGLLVLLVWTGGITLQLYLASRHWLPVCFRLDFQILLITFGACCGLALHYVASLSEATLDPEDLWNSLPEKIQFAPICTELLCSMWFKLFFHSFFLWFY